MTKKNLKPQQAAPVQREIINTTASVGTGLMIPLWARPDRTDPGASVPFAGDDAE
jgi:hypothetical protein